MRKFTFFFKSLLVAFLLLGGANSAWAATEIISWKADGETSTAAATNLVNVTDLTATTTFATTLQSENVTIDDMSFTHAIQVRVTNNPTTSVPNGTEYTGSTSIVITPKFDGDLKLYYKRQKYENTFTSNDSKDIRIFKQSDASIQTGSLTLQKEDGDYGWVTKVVPLKGKTSYTITARGTTARLYGLKYTYIPWTDVYSKALSEWTDADVSASEWVATGVTPTISTAEGKGLCMKQGNPAYTVKKTLSVSQDVKLKIEGVWNVNRVTGNNSNYNYIQFGDNIRISVPNSGTFYVNTNGTSSSTTETGVSTTSKDTNPYTFSIVINTAKRIIESFYFNNVNIKSLTPGTISGNFDSFTIGYQRGGSSANNDNILTSIEVTEQALPKYDYTINYTYGDDVIKSEEGEAIEGATVNASYTSLWNDGDTQKYFVTGEATTSMIITKEGPNVLEVALREAASDAVASINLVCGGTTHKIISSTEGIEGEEITLYYPKAMVSEIDGKYYSVSTTNYSKNLTYGTSTDVEYVLDESIVYFNEANLAATGSDVHYNDANCSSGTYVGYYASRTASITIAKPGIYRMETNVRGRINKNPLNVYDNANNQIGTIAKNSTPSTGERHTENFLISESNTTIKVGGTNFNTLSFDYILIRKIYDIEGEVVGAIDYTTPYWSKWNTTPVWINAGETGYYKIKNHNNGANTYENWYLYAANESSENKTVLRADKHVNIGSGTLVWEDYNEGTVVADLSDATVDISVSLEDAGDGTYTLTSTAIVTKADGTEMSPYIYTQTGYTENKLKLFVSVEKSWLEVLAQGTIVNEELNTNMSGYKTFYNAISNYKVDANTTIYKAAEPSAGKVVLTEVDGDVIKAGQPVILHTSETTIEITPTDAASTGDYIGNALHVADGSQSNKYVLGYTSANGFGFYYYTAPLPAGYIYLDGAAPNPGVKVFSVVADGTATGVEAPEVTEAEEEEEILYNTAGVRVGKDYKGIVINQKGEKRLQK